MTVKKLFIMLLSCMLFVYVAMPAFATTGNEQWYHSGGWVRGNVDKKYFGSATSTVSASTVYVGQKIRLHATEECYYPDRKVTIAICKGNGTTALASVTRTADISASKGQYYPSETAYTKKVGTSHFSCVKDQVYRYRLESIVSSTIEGLYAGYLSTISG